MRINIAIDGPSGAGKSSLAKAVAKELGLIHVDTGAMYRTVGLYMLENGIDPKDPEAVSAVLNDVKVELEFQDGVQHIYLNGRCVDSLIRSNEASMYASYVSAIQAVRDFLLNTQRQMAEKQDVIMDGRDIGTVILPNAALKIFLVANDEARARRRYKELTEKGESVTFEEVLDLMKKRDEKDKGRKIAPAVPADDAVIFDNTEYDLQQCVDYIISLAKERFSI
ncbi:MAG: (d)CMP kinase [Clostridia bacterium]|nr:(d)CMP kinase [Clostridia bacterium]